MSIMSELSEELGRTQEVSLPAETDSDPALSVGEGVSGASGGYDADILQPANQEDGQFGELEDSAESIATARRQVGAALDDQGLVESADMTSGKNAGDDREDGADGTQSAEEEAELTRDARSEQRDGADSDHDDADQVVGDEPIGSSGVPGGDEVEDARDRVRAALDDLGTEPDTDGAGSGTPDDPDIPTGGNGRGGGDRGNGDADSSAEGGEDPEEEGADDGESGVDPEGDDADPEDEDPEDGHADAEEEDVEPQIGFPDADTLRARLAGSRAPDMVDAQLHEEIALNLADQSLTPLQAADEIAAALDEFEYQAGDRPGRQARADLPQLVQSLFPDEPTLCDAVLRAYYEPPVPELAPDEQRAMEQTMQVLRDHDVPFVRINDRDAPAFSIMVGTHRIPRLAATLGGNLRYGTADSQRVDVRVETGHQDRVNNARLRSGWPLIEAARFELGGDQELTLGVFPVERRAYEIVEASVLANAAEGDTSTAPPISAYRAQETVFAVRPPREPDDPDERRWPGPLFGARP